MTLVITISANFHDISISSFPDILTHFDSGKSWYQHFSSKAHLHYLITSVFHDIASHFPVICVSAFLHIYITSTFYDFSEHFDNISILSFLHISSHIIYTFWWPDSKEYLQLTLTTLKYFCMNYGDQIVLSHLNTMVWVYGHYNFLFLFSVRWSSLDVRFWR